MQYEITANVPGQWYILVKGNHNEPPVALFYDLDAAEAFIVSLGAGVQQQTTTDAARDAQDAARYRWLRRGQTFSVVDGLGNDLRADELDAAIDGRLDRAKGE